MNIDKFTVTSYDRMTGFDRITGELYLDMDELTDFTLNQTQEVSEITGKGGRVVSRMKKNKAVTGSGTNGFLSGGTLAAMLGCDIEESDGYVIKYTDNVVVNANTAMTTKKAVGTPGMEIGTVYIRNANNAYITGGRKLIQVATSPSQGEFTYDPTTNTLEFFAGGTVPAYANIVTGTTVYGTTGSASDGTGAIEITNANIDDYVDIATDGTVALKVGVNLWDADNASANDVSADVSTYITGFAEAISEPADITDGTEIIMFYDTKVSGGKITNDADKYSKVLKLFVDVTCQDACDAVFHGQFIIYRADFDGEFEITGGSEPSTQSFGFTSMPDTCLGKSILWDFIVFND